MAVSSPLNPRTIVKERPTTLSGAMNFVSGGSPLGSSVFSSAANKIVGFQRGAAGVAPKASDLGSIINTLSSNILNNVENQVQSVNQNVTNIVNQTLKSFGQDYQNKLKQIDDAKPNRILSNFLKMYQQAIEYIQFLGNRKNIKTLGDNLQSLQRIFAETFEITKTIRQTIVKIVKQLSNLPTASTGGGGLNLDVKVPGGPLRRSAPKGLNKMLKIAGTGAAIAGAGALGSKVVSGMLDIGGGDVQPMAGGGSEGLSGPILDRFSAILDRFGAAIDSLSKKPAAKPSAPSGGAKSSGETKPPPADPGGPGGPSISSAPGDEKLAAFVATMEASSPENAADAMQVMLNRSASGYSKQGLGGVISGREQFSPMSAAIYGTSADKTAAKKYGPIAAKLPGKTPQEKFKYLQQIAAQPDGLAQLEKIFGAGSGATAAKILNDPKYLEASRKNVKGALNFGAKSIAEPGDVQIRPGGNYFYNYTGKVGSLSGKPTGEVAAAKAGVAASPTQAATTQQVSQTVAQPPPQQQSQVNILPLNLGSAQPQQSQKASTPSSPPPTMSGGRTIPSFSPTNHDNFLTLYSKMVYNIVDG